MKHWGFLAVLVGIALIAWCLNAKEGFTAEVVDRTNVERTIDTEKSSYAQQTNHVVPTRPLEEPLDGIETPFRVNQWTSFQPV